MNRLTALLLLSLFLSACGLAPTPAPDVTVTLQVTVTSTLTPTPAPTETPTPTPIPPPEALARLEGRDWRIENNQVMVGTVAWYTQDAEGQWQPAPFVADFESYEFSLDGLDIVNENGVVRAIDPNATDEARRIVYEDGKANILFAVDSAGSNCKPTKFIPVPRGNNHFYVANEVKDDFLNELKTLLKRARESGLPAMSATYTPVVLNMTKNCWARVQKETSILFFANQNDKIIIIPLMAGWFDAFFK